MRYAQELAREMGYQIPTTSSNDNNNMGMDVDSNNLNVGNHNLGPQSHFQYDQFQEVGLLVVLIFFMFFLMCLWCYLWFVFYDILTSTITLYFYFCC